MSVAAYVPGEPSGPKTYTTVSIRELLAAEYPPLRWIIDDILPEGLALLFAGPKIGKSMVALYIAIRMALGKLAGSGKRVLYLSLDDRSQRRLRDRVRWILSGTEIDDGIDFWFDADHLDKSDPDGTEKGLLWQLSHYHRHNPDTALYIIDVYAAIKPKKADSDIFRSDYETIAAIRDWAERHHVAVLLLHHSRKKSDPDDWVREVNGTTGIAAGVDTLWYLDRKRGGQEMTLRVTGRDVEDCAVKIDLDDLAKEWLTEEESGQTEEVRVTNRAHKSYILEFCNSSRTPKEIAEALDMKIGTVRLTMRRLLSQGLVEQTRYGCYITARVTNDENAKNTNVTLEEDSPRPPIPFPMTPGHPWARECMGQCLRRVKPASGEACPRCNLVRWERDDLGGAPLYICRHCHPHTGEAIE